MKTLKKKKIKKKQKLNFIFIQQQACDYQSIKKVRFEEVF